MPDVAGESIKHQLAALFEQGEKLDGKVESSPCEGMAGVIHTEEVSTTKETWNLLMPHIAWQSGGTILAIQQHSSKGFGTSDDDAYVHVRRDLENGRPPSIGYSSTFDVLHASWFMLTFSWRL